MMTTDTEEMDELLVELHLVASFMREVRLRPPKWNMNWCCFRSALAGDGEEGGAGVLIPSLTSFVV